MCRIAGCIGFNDEQFLRAMGHDCLGRFHSFAGAETTRAIYGPILRK